MATETQKSIQLSPSDVETIAQNSTPHSPTPDVGDTVHAIVTPHGKFVFLDRVFHWIENKAEQEVVTDENKGGK